MYGTDSVTDESERTAFRRVEKKYKLYYDQKTKSSKKKKQPRPVDLTEVIDFESNLESFNRNGKLPPGVLLVELEFDLPVLCLEKRPANERKILVDEKSLLDCLNTDKNSLVNDLAPGWKSSEEPRASSRGNACKSTSASALLRKLRWSTLGLQFDWSKRNYNVALPHNKIPYPLCQLAKKVAAPAVPLEEKFKPEAAIVNYFGSGGMLGGHLDDMETDWSKPIVSISLGCKVVFLLGGNPERMTHSRCFFEVVILYLWLEKLGSAFMMEKMQKSPTPGVAVVT